MFKGVARTIFYLLLTIPLIVIGILITRQIEFAFELRKDFVQGSRPGIPAADVAQIMASNELATRSFFLIFICFLMILCGLLITVRNTERAFVHSKDERIKYSLRSAYPGLIMAVFGCLLLAYSVYSSSQVHFTTTRQLLATMPSHGGTGQPVTESGDNIVYQADLDTTTSAPAAEESVQQMLGPKAAVSVSAEAQQSQPARIIPVVADVPVTAEDVRWADRLAVRSIAYGYYPTQSDNVRYGSILKRLTTGGSTLHLNSDLQWAFRLLQKTQQGYAPTERELKRYEEIVGKQLGGSKEGSKDLANF